MYAIRSYYDLAHMLDVGRTDVLAGAAGGAGPDGIAADGVDQVGLGVGKGHLANLVDQLHRRKRLVGIIGSYNFV